MESLERRPSLRIVVSFFMLLLCSNRGFSQASTPPHIFTQPQSQMIGSGARATFSSDLNPFSTYQWFHEGEPLSFGTNNTLILKNLTVANAGAYRVTISNNIGSVTSNPARLVVVPQAQLRSIASVPTTGFAMWVKVRNQRAYIADNKLQIYDVSNAAAPVKIGTYGTTTTRISAFDFSGDTAYCLDGYSLHIVDVSNPASPTLRKKVNLPLSGGDIIVRDGFAYIGGTALAIYDVTDPGNPIAVSTNSVGSIYTLEKVSNVLFLGATNKRVLLLDVSDPANPTLLSTLTDVTFVDTVKVAGTRLYVAGNSFAVYDITVPNKPRLLGVPRAQPEASFFAGVTGMTAVGDFMFHGGSIENEGLYLVDASNPSFAGRIGYLKLPGRIEGAEWAENRLFLAHGSTWGIVEWGPATNAPVVTLPLQDVLAVPGTNLRLETAASGGEPLTWQWYKEQTPLPGETNRTLNLPAISEADFVQYSAIAANGVGQVSAGSATINQVAPSSFHPLLRLGDSRGPRLTLAFPPGLQATVQGSSNLIQWDSVWSGEARPESIEIIDTAGRGSPERFYRLKYGRE